MTENNIDAIKGGLANYVGALQEAVDLKGIEKNQFVASVLMDALLDVAKTKEDDPYCSPFVLVPLFSGMQGVLIQQIQRIKSDSSTEEDPEARVKRYTAMINELNHLIEYGMFQKGNDFGKKEKN